jgi:Trk K+ transport system NAD-binding subunit
MTTPPAQSTPPPTNRQTPGEPQGHIVLSGLDGLGLRTLEELDKLGEQVIVIAKAGSGVFVSRARRLGAQVIVGDDRDEAVLRSAGIESAASYVLSRDDDVGNLHSALAAQDINPNLRLVIRIFNLEFGQRIESLFRDCAVLSSSAIAAPAFVAAAMPDACEQQVEVGGRMLEVRTARPGTSGVLLPLGRVRDGEPEELFPRSGEDALCLIDATGFTPATLARKRRQRSAGVWAYLRAVVGGADARLRYALLFLVLLATVSTLVFMWGRGIGPVDALYYAVTAITTAGLADFDPARTPLALKLFGIGLMVIGATTLTVFFALITDAIVSIRLERALGRVPVGLREHIVVCGLGNVGYRVVTRLHELGMLVAATEKAEDSRSIPQVRRLGIPVVIGDARSPETLQALNVAAARCVVVATDDDAANLETALNARAQNPDIRVVLRLFDPDLAARVERAFNIPISRSVSALAAPSFAAAAVGQRVVASIAVGKRVLIVAQTQIEPGSSAGGSTVANLESNSEGRVLLVERHLGKEWQPAPDRTLSPGDVITVVATRRGLIQMLDSTEGAQAGVRAATPVQG